MIYTHKLPVQQRESLARCTKELEDEVELKDISTNVSMLSSRK